MKLIKTTLSLLIGLLVLVGCQTKAQADIVTTSFIGYDITTAIVGDTLTVKNLTPWGSEIHDFDPNPQNITEASKAGLFVYMSDDLETWASTISNENVLNLSEVVASHEHEHHDHEGVRINGLKEHYHSNDTVELEAVLSEDLGSDHWHWFITRPNQEEQVIEGQGDSTLEYTATLEDNGATLIARLYGDDHEVIAHSDAIVLEVVDHGSHDHDDHDHTDDHGSEDDHDHSDMTVSITGLSDHYHTHDTLSLIAETTPETDHDHWHWFITRPGQEEAVIDGQGTHELSLELETADNNSVIVARLYGDNHEVIAESEPVEVQIENHGTHFWTDTHNMLVMIEETQEKLSALYPEHKETFEKNATAYIDEISALDEDLVAFLKTVDEKTLFFSGHNALDGFAQHYGLSIKALHDSYRPNADTTAQDILTLKNELLDHKAHVLYHEELVEPVVAKQIQEELAKVDTPIELLELHGYHNITQSQFKEGVRFSDLFKQNIENIKKGLSH